MKRSDKGYMREYYLKNKEILLKKHKEYRDKPENKIKAKTDNKKWQEKNKEKISAYKKQWRAKNKVRLAEEKKQYYLDNKERLSVYKVEYRKTHQETLREWRRKNSGLLNSCNANRRAMRINATPSYADLEAIKKIYRTAQILSKMTGVNMSVDHIIPLRSKLVCGLHHQDNLQIIPAKENSKKSNKFTPITIDYQYTIWNLPPKITITK